MRIVPVELWTPTDEAALAVKALEVKINTNVKSLYVYCQTGGKKKNSVKYQVVEVFRDLNPIHEVHSCREHLKGELLHIHCLAVVPNSRT